VARTICRHHPRIPTEGLLESGQQTWWWNFGLAFHAHNVLLARLAVDRTEHGTGLGRTMLVDALSRAMTAADAIGARSMLVHAIDEDAVAFYRKFGFEPSPLDPKQLMLLMKDLRATLQSVGLG
jgi:GNAT superfamily N-acetyltransferase